MVHPPPLRNRRSVTHHSVRTVRHNRVSTTQPPLPLLTSFSFDIPITDWNDYYNLNQSMYLVQQLLSFVIFLASLRAVKFFKILPYTGRITSSILNVRRRSISVSSHHVTDSIRQSLHRLCHLLLVCYPHVCHVISPLLRFHIREHSHLFRFHIGALENDHG